MISVAGWIALASTCVAATLTASNLGPRITGWASFIFTIGAIGWIIVGVMTHQKQLIYSNVFLTAVDIFGIWRWLGFARRQPPILGSVINVYTRRRSD